MPRLGSGPAIGLPHIKASPDEGVSKPARMRSRVDLPQPEAPIRQTNSPLAILRLAPDTAWMGWPWSWNSLETRRNSTIGMVASAMMIGTPAQQPVADRHHRAIGQK